MRFEREATTLASLNHPHIAQIYGIEVSACVRALVMELVEGEDLAAQIARGPMPLDEAVPIARQIAEALEAAHEAGIIHRDLKPANIPHPPDELVRARARRPESESLILQVRHLAGVRPWGRDRAAGRRRLGLRFGYEHQRIKAPRVLGLPHGH
jgi:predicted ATPase